MAPHGPGQGTSSCSGVMGPVPRGKSKTHRHFAVALMFDPGARFPVFVGVMICIAVASRCFPVNLFTAHPLGMSLGVLAFLNMALASIRARKDAKEVESRKTYVIGHAVLVVLTLVCVPELVLPRST